MRQNFISLFGRMDNVKPAYLREIYHELTGDSSAASSEIECHVNERVKQALELEDPDLVVDLRQHNIASIRSFEKHVKVIFKGILKQQLIIGDMILLSIWLWPCLSLTYNLKLVKK